MVTLSTKKSTLEHQNSARCQHGLIGYLPVIDLLPHSLVSNLDLIISTLSRVNLLLQLLFQLLGRELKLFQGVPGFGQGLLQFSSMLLVEFEFFVDRLEAIVVDEIGLSVNKPRNHRAAL